MKRFGLAALSLLLLPATTWAEGWVTLFDGTELDQWTMGPDESWIVKDGIITLDRKEFDGKEHNADYLWTKEQYGDFVLELEFRVPEKANSGVFLRTSDLDDPVQTGLELQVTNSFGRDEMNPRNTIGALYDLAAPTANASRPAGQWNKYRVTCLNSHVTVEVNGRTVNALDLAQWTEPNKNPDGSRNKFHRAIKDFARRGHIGLQDHGRPVEYRNIRVQRLDAPGAYRLANDPVGKTLLTPDGRVILRYMTKKPADTNLAANSVCCLYPVNTPSGVRTVDFAPPDHPHHRGIFLAWHAIDSAVPADFWGWGEWAPTEDRVIVNRELTPMRLSEQEAVFAVINQWMAGDTILVEEQSTFRAAEVDDAFVIDATYRLTPTTDLTLRHTAFGGFCVKSRQDGERFYLDENGPVTLANPHHLKPETDWPARDWYAFQIALESGGTFGVAVVDHPANPPTVWHNLKPISMINPCIAAPAALEMPAGKTRTLKYRVITFDGPANRERIAALAEEFRKE